MKTSEQINELAAALAKAQGQIASVEKNATVEIATKTGGKFTFQYTTLDKIFEALQKPFSDNGLSIIQSPAFGDGALTLTTRILHSSGQWLEDEMSVVPGNDDIKTLGSTITYLKRYAISAMARIASDEDTDAKAEMTIKAKVNGQPKPKTFDPEQLLGQLNRVSGVSGYYADTGALKEAIMSLENDDAWEWPKPEEMDRWRKLFAVVRDHVLETLEINQETA